MTIKRTFANVCSISDRHVLDLLSLFDLKTSDPLFDGESSSWQAAMAETGDWSNRRKQKKQSNGFRRGRR